MKRNIGMHTSAEDAKRNILAFLAQRYTDDSKLAAKSIIGYAAYPDYNFKSPQGAAFSVAKIVSALETDGLVRYGSRTYPTFRRGHYITAKGIASLVALTAKEEQSQ